ncbi:TPR-like protein [Rhizoclosmatium globosum]|uniref:TPR-like protein n=1 Tax=Rhizoclosmatium globosum TaxID=329046 RepID=A0A1Y2CL17_9FUNG|nr:TPR-like protein [Rhizoclosmatium globosum]|eukprot:ORY47676.1 TPR-like protein [Rhizoclosmatium globosum]
MLSSVSMSSPAQTTQTTTKDSSFEAALLVRQNAEETQRQIKELLAWEKDVKTKEPKATKQQLAPPPVRSLKKDDAVPDKPQRIKAYDYRAWDKFDVGNAYFKKGDYTKAIKAYSKSLKLNPENILVLGNRAMTYLKLNDFEKAEADCTAVLEVDPKNVKALWRRGVARHESGSNLAGAKKDLDMALVLEPTNASVKQELVKLTNAMSAAKASKKPITQNTAAKQVRRRVEIIEVGDAKAYSAPGSTQPSSALLDSDILTTNSDLQNDIQIQHQTPRDIQIQHQTPRNTPLIVSLDDTAVTPPEITQKTDKSQEIRAPIRGHSIQLQTKSTIANNDISVTNQPNSSVQSASVIHETLEPKSRSTFLNIVPIDSQDIPDKDIEITLTTKTLPPQSRLITEVQEITSPPPISESKQKSEQTPTIKPPTSMFEFELEWKNHPSEPFSKHPLNLST